MDLKNLLVQPEKKPTDTLKKRSSINDLVNAVDEEIRQQQEQQQQQQQPPPSYQRQPPAASQQGRDMASPALPSKTIPPHSTEQTPGSSVIRARNSISSLTNDTDVDVDGTETPSIARRLSYDVTTSETNSPVIPKRTISRPPSLQNVINSMDEEEEEHEKKRNRELVDEASKKRKPSDEGYVVELKKTKKDDELKKEAKSLSDELDALNKLEKKETTALTKDGKLKPRRYAEPPIWATKWVSTFKKKSTNSRSNVSASSDSADTLTSITGVKPYNDTTRRITNWVYAQILAVPKEQRHFLELEVKFGRLWHKQTDRRVHIPVTNECIVEDNFILDCQYRSGLDREHFDRAKKFVTGLSKLHKEKFRTFKTDQIDRVYREAYRGKIPRFYRLTTDKATSRLTANIEKKKLANLHIHCPDMIFDFRLTMSLELPSSENPERFENHTPETERHKKRTSIIHATTATRIDLTEVSQRVKGKSDEYAEFLEMELEVDMPKLLKAFDKLDQDAFTFEQLGETFMDNARVINRELIKPVPK